MAIDTKLGELEPFYVAVIRGESCFEKNAFEDTENPHPPTKTRLPVKEYLGKYSRYRKKFCFVLKLFLRPILFHGKLSFDNLNYFKLYGNLKAESICWSFRTFCWVGSAFKMQSSSIKHELQFFVRHCILYRVSKLSI